MQKKIEKLIAQMTLEEKASLCSGQDNWHTKPVERLGIQSVMMCDGPHGLRKQIEGENFLDINDSHKAVCYPTACATACSFDRELLYELGQALGDECRANDIALLLGPGANIKRSPLCGRNFEYFSEDPYHSSQMAAAFIAGVQSRGVGTSLKHYLANNQETRRMSISANVAPRPLREIYLASFEDAVKKAKPYSVMCSYNRLNGTYVSEDPFSLNQVLRDEWRFEGFTVSDWGAVNDRIKGLKAGLDLEMPSSGGVRDEAIVTAVREGFLDEKIVDRALVRILKFVIDWHEKERGIPFDPDAHHALSHRISSESMVLLKNDGLLPLQRAQKIAFIGEFAENPRYQGSGSSHVNSYKLESAVDVMRGNDNISYAQGYSLSDESVNDALLKEALKVAKSANVAVVFVGLPDSYESEGFDRNSLEMPKSMNKLIIELSAVQQNLIVVLHNGSPVAMPWLSNVPAVLEAYLGGQAVGRAVCDVLFGDVNPCGKLSESFPMKLSDNPSYLNFPGEDDEVNYAEGLFVGYRYYDKKELQPLFPFGHGLSYTVFEYTGINLSAEKISDADTLVVTISVKNIGNYAGKEIVQLYVADREASVIRPQKELKGFEKVFFVPGEEKSIRFELDKRAFAYWNESINDWHVESGYFDILVGGSSKSLPLRAVVYVIETVKLRKVFHINSILSEILPTEVGQTVIMPRIKNFVKSLGINDFSFETAPEMLRKMIEDLPLRGLISQSKGAVTQSDLEVLIEMLNNEE